MPELVILQALSAPVERDGWTWLQYALSVIATVTAIVAFSQWALELRRRPEVAFSWKFSPGRRPGEVGPMAIGLCT